MEGKLTQEEAGKELAGTHGWANIIRTQHGQTVWKMGRKQRDNIRKQAAAIGETLPEEFLKEPPDGI